MSKTHYQTLGIDNTATDVEIKKAYRSLSLKYHPDRNQSSDATVMFQEISTAYEILGDSEKKKEYDNERNGTKMNPFQGFHNMDNMFNMMFNGVQMNSSMPNIQIFRNGNTTTHVFRSNMGVRTPDTITQQLNITLEQAYSGLTLPIEIERWVHENGARRPEIETIQVELPPGINNNETITLGGKGNILETIHGDVKLLVNVRSNDLFQRRGLDLCYLKKISLKEALCGFAFEFIHVSGKKLGMNNVNPSIIIKPGHKQIIEGLGMKRDNMIGKLIFDFEIEFPNELSSDQMEHIKNGLP